MKIILSRKGFDSSAGGVPSPILPDGRLLSLPIPDPLSNIRYRDIKSFDGGFDGRIDGGIGKLVADLTRGRINSAATTHLDPDLLQSSLPRQSDWRPIFGQSGAAQGHLRNQQVEEGDVFVFFGLFQRVKKSAGKYIFDRACPKQHIIYGWLQIGDIVPVSNCPENISRWADYHPHFSHPESVSNTLYLASDNFRLDDRQAEALPGAGLFATDSARRTLTADNARSPSQWQLPPWFNPTGNKPPLSYHSNPGRWKKTATHTHLQAVSRGQEFVLDCDYYPEALKWLQNLITGSKLIK